MSHVTQAEARVRSDIKKNAYGKDKQNCPKLRIACGQK
jgi:hypothetical protein